MKKLKCAVAFVLSLALVFAFMPTAFAAKNKTEGTVKIMCYNVAGLPISLKVPKNQHAIGSIITDSGCDIVAVQEDFNIHGILSESIDKSVYPYQTIHTGGVPGGDGLNIYSKHKIYNEIRTSWNVANGVFDAGADELTPKGILFSVIDLGNGIYLDFYDIHADANGTKEDNETRAEQYRQLKEIIKKRNSKNPVIIVGDFNTSIHYNTVGDAELNDGIYEECGFRDAWFEVHNGGKYSLKSLQPWIDEYGGYGYEQTKGKWNSIEKILFKSGKNVKLTAKSQEYVQYEDYSDHPAVIVELDYSVKGKPISNNEELIVNGGDIFARLDNSAVSFFETLHKILSNIPVAIKNSITSK